MAGQLILCRGCCCGRPERGFPAVPVDRIKAIWKAEKLNRTIQLTISGCVGPCDLANVAVVLGPGEIEWYGRLAGEDVYDCLIAWARDCKAAGKRLPIPPLIARQRFERFIAPTQSE